MSNIYKYIIVGITLVLVFISYRYYSLSNEHEILTLKYTQLQSQYAVEKANTSALENSIRIQNMEIERYKKTSDEYEIKISKLNKEIEELNDIDVEYIHSNNEKASSEEAIIWLKQQASSLVR